MPILHRFVATVALGMFWGACLGAVEPTPSTVSNASVAPTVSAPSPNALPAASAPLGVPPQAASVSLKPVTPDAMPETVALFNTLKAISGHYTLTGQHNPPSIGGRNSAFAATYTGRIPAVWTSDFGFAEAGNSDSYQSRSIVVAEAIRQHKQGAIISLCWHAVPPTADEPVTFRPLPGADPAALKSVQGRLLDSQFKDLLTPGTPLNQHWMAQVDAVAVFLKQLQDAHVPVLWRPYHEMNGDWFWWGGRTEGQYTTAALYRQLFDRFVNYHHLKNLLWLWSVDRVSKPGMEHTKFFPGIDYVDVLGLDVYGNDFAQSYYESLVDLSQGKPLALAEVGNVPPPEILEKQPLWTYYSVWTSMVRNSSKTDYSLAFATHVVSMEDPAFAAVSASYRKACHLPVLQGKEHPVNFSGNWIINQDISKFGHMGAAFAPARLEVGLNGKELTVRSTRIREVADDEVENVVYKLDGTETKSQFMKFPRVTTGSLSDDGTAIILRSIAYPPVGPDGTRFESKETWVILDQVHRLAILRVSDSLGSPEKTVQTLIYDRE